MPKNLLVAQGGGPTVVINESLVAIIREGRKQGFRVFGARHGVRGIIEDNLIDLTHLNEGELDGIAATPSAALRSTRDKPNIEYCDKILEKLVECAIHGFIYIGGNDSADTLRLINERRNEGGYQVRLIHVPKTVDNDLVLSHHSPGFPSAALYVAQTFMGADLDFTALPGVYIGIIMGRESGFLTAASAAARTYSGCGPHLIYLPERPFSSGQFVRDVERVATQLGRCIVAVSEGIRFADGTFVTATTGKTKDRDPHGNITLSGSADLGDLLASMIKHVHSRVRADTFGYVQRWFPGCISDLDRVHARGVGAFAVTSVVNGECGCVVISSPLGSGYTLAAFSDVARKTRTLPPEFFRSDTPDVTTACRDYLTGLIGHQLPKVHRL